VTRRILGYLVRVVLVLAAAILPIAIGFVRFADHIPGPTTDASHTDAIVVLTGGGARISTGLALLESGKAQRLFVSGVHPGVGVAELLRIDRTLSGSAPPEPSLASRIDLGDTAGDTFGNSVETVAWMRAHHFHSMRLVTADYHMRRAMIEFRMEAPDLRIISNPVKPPGIDDARWWQSRAAANLLLGEYGKYLIARWRGILAKITGKLE
jgi:uncharacterized SAM-binding protein YcdF (DUF218 family)